MLMTRTGVSQETAEAVLNVVASFLQREPIVASRVVSSR